MYKFFLLVLLSAVINSICASESEAMRNMNPMFTEQYVMLYYKDIVPASDFYEKVLGLKVILDDEWVKLYQVVPGSFVGVVQEGGTAYHKSRENNSVMLSLVSEDVDAWYEIVRSTEAVTVLKEIYDHESVPIRAFLIADPGGYTVEFFQWRNKQAMAAGK